MTLRSRVFEGIGVLASTVGVWLSFGQASGDAIVAEENTQGGQAEPKYLGAESCAGCHAMKEPAATKRQSSDKTEYHKWNGSDRHSKAYSVLKEKKTADIARRLKLKTLPKDWENPEQPPKEWEQCLNCHSMNLIPQPLRGQSFKLSDGVSCDGCHGPAELWLGPHLEREYPVSLKLGMKDIRDPLVRAETCVSCHAGNRAEGKIVDHELLAAGHPPLVFELDAYSQRMPPHWRDKPPQPQSENLPRARVWAVGQLVTAREAARLVAADAGSDRWPEYSHFDCSACHHDLEAGWRQQRPDPTPLGRPAWQMGDRTVILGQLVGDSRSLLDSLGLVSRAMASRPFGDARQAAGAAATLAELLDEAAKAVASQSLPPERVRELALRVSESANAVAWRGPQPALQLAYALQALIAQLATDGAAPARRQIASVIKGLEDGSHYEPGDFIEKIVAVRHQLADGRTPRP